MDDRKVFEEYLNVEAELSDTSSFEEKAEQRQNENDSDEFFDKHGDDDIKRETSDNFQRSFTSKDDNDDHDEQSECHEAEEESSESSSSSAMLWTATTTTPGAGMEPIHANTPEPRSRSSTRFQVQWLYGTGTERVVGNRYRSMVHRSELEQHNRRFHIGISNNTAITIVLPVVATFLLCCSLYAWFRVSSEISILVPPPPLPPTLGQRIWNILSYTQTCLVGVFKKFM